MLERLEGQSYVQTGEISMRIPYSFLRELLDRIVKEMPWNSDSQLGLYLNSPIGLCLVSGAEMGPKNLYFQRV